MKTRRRDFTENRGNKKKLNISAQWKDTKKKNSRNRKDGLKAVKEKISAIKDSMQTFE